MSQVTQTGGEFIQSIDTQNPDTSFPLYTYLSFGSIAGQNWNSATYDSASASKKLNFKSSEGSTLGFVSANSGDDTEGSESFLLNLKTNSKDSFLVGNNESWTSTASSKKNKRKYFFYRRRIN